MTGLAEKLVKAADDYLASRPVSEEELTGRYWVVEQIIRQCLARKEQLVIFSEHLANLEFVAGLLTTVTLQSILQGTLGAYPEKLNAIHLCWAWNKAIIEITIRSMW